jgi:phage terminase large subunit GpA-like protein
VSTINIDEAPQNAIDMAMERMAHSEHREVLKLSNPRLPDYGIDKAFQETDQRYWLLKYEKCGEYTCLEDDFPDCLINVHDRVIRACHRCKSELNPSIGQWVAKRPSITNKRGRHYSQLFSHFVDPADILHQFRTTNNLTDFYNLKIGIAYVEATNRLTIEEVLYLCGSEGIAEQDPGALF